MSCAACGTADAPGKVSLTPNVHKPICQRCAALWEEGARKAVGNIDNHGTVLMAFRRWCEARKKVAHV